MIDKILACIATLALLVVIAAIGYNELYHDDVKVVVDLKQDEDPFVAIRQIVPADSAIKEVREVDRGRNEYEIVVRTKRERKSLLEWFKRSHRVEKVEIKSKQRDDDDD